MKPVEISGRMVGPGEPCLLIAEAGVNHNGSLERAQGLVEAAAAAGTDAVKFQTFKAEDVVSPSAPKAGYQKETTGGDESQLDMLKHLALPDDAFQSLYAECQSKGVLFLSTPFDEGSVDLLDALGVAAFKVPSGEITNLPFLSHIARRGRPLILSTGMATLEEVESALRTVRSAGNRDLILLHCVSRYPAPPSAANLRAMHTLAAAFDVPVGYSDHTLGIEVSLAAVALGACVIEKHFTLDKGLPGPDHRASVEPEEMAALVRGMRRVEAALGHGRKEPDPGEEEIAAVARKSLVAARDISAGTILSEDLVTIRRPGTGLLPAMRPQLIGRRVRCDIAAGDLLSLEQVN
ncbi:MAG: N-acetylneuraminate synthase [Nitrospinota bacterium]|nr:N-acetylneuraminate synthase [Nitrospinota bacterium]